MRSTTDPSKRRLPLVRLGIALAITCLLVPTARSASAGAATTAPTCGGTAIPKATGGTWQCTFADEFDGTTLDTSKWVVQQTATSGFVNGPECYVNSPNNVSVANGTLNLTARKEAAPFKCVGNWQSQYTSASVNTSGKFNQAYGRFEVRAKVPSAKVKGLQETFWLWPQDSNKYGTKWPASGEIDFAEFYSQYSNLVVPYVHYNPLVKDPNVTSYKCTISVGDFHTYTLEWSATQMKIMYDGKTCLVDQWKAAAPLTGSAPFDQPFFMNLTQALGIYTNAFDANTTPLPATTQVDYVRIWK